MTDTVHALLSATPESIAIFTDFDGTLVDIAPSPDAVVVPSHGPGKLDALYTALGGALAIVSGRTVRDIESYLPDQGVTIIGSHGAEIRHNGALQAVNPEFKSTASAIAAALDKALGREAGILIEPKPTGVAVHYRAAPEKREMVQKTVAHTLAHHDGYHAIDGKMVVEARPLGTDKGTAITALLDIAPFEDRIPIFVGDDVTDEDGFRAAAALGGFGVKVGEGETAARFRLPDIASVYRYFEAVAARELDRRSGISTSATSTEKYTS